MGSFQRKMTLTASPEDRTKTEAPVSYRYLPQEHRAKWPGKKGLRGALSTEEERPQWMRSPREGCLWAFPLAVPSLRKVLPQTLIQLIPFPPLPRSLCTCQHLKERPFLSRLPLLYSS